MKDLNVKMIFVEWVDACAHAGWTDGSDLGIETCYSCGFLVKETKEAISIASAISQHHANACISIPKAWIKKKRIIKL